ncbi:hypothetical protein GCM10009007_15960 [Formosimonas limnophila]|uniref:VWFA domain-containing protein n=1 Tax=Formosimonas limnophila TaxID=1384487 RepID=A0A8J3CLX1_9BURK|nr:vWA domain-containing protein [Formosimonas limnophila]GHA75588.1 hypothetical protein GCM10009007_15960 [Formosimonas limnophila]
MNPTIRKTAAASLIASGVLFASSVSAKSVVVMPSDNNTIQVALLLDTSNSMDGLIEQAKSRLWNIVNTLTTLKYNGQTPKIQIALYEYGNNDLSEGKNWIRQVTPLTQDLDLISEKLFALRTNGGNEYVGAVIADATKGLEWNSSRGSMKLVYVAGNEPFNQGGVDYREAISDARRSNIYINTIYCGDVKDAINTLWKDGAERGLGKYFAINSDAKVRHIDTPYDAKISALNNKLNDTYIGYGSMGYAKKQAQVTQDMNAASLSAANSVERAVTKSKSAAYSNSNWDVVDKYKDDKNFVMNTPDRELPAELQGKTAAEKTAFIEAKSTERAQIQKEISELSTQRQSYIDAKTKQQANHEGDDLGKAIEKSIMDIAQKNGYTQ